jgi:hypothetical protein
VLAVVCGASVAAGTATALASEGTAQSLSATPSTTQPYAACPPTPAGEAACQAVIEPAGAKLDSMSAATAAPATSGIDGSGLAPAELQSAYKLPSSSAGSGQTVAIVDAYNDPTAESDLAAYRSAYGLPSCTSAGGCFDKVSQTGSTSYPPQPTAEEGDWPVEESLDLDMVSAICPNCHIMLVEANSAGMGDLGTAENEAVKLGAAAVSNSWGSFEFQGETSYDSYFDHPGIPITVASGDWGYDNDEYNAGVPSYPAASPDVIAVGGTVLTPASNSRGWSESVWSRSGSGCSVYEAKPSYQTDSGCSKRTTNDIAAVAEDLSIYDTSGTSGEGKLAGWYTVGGTSAATPIIAAVEALSGSETRSLGASAFYKNPSSFFAVMSGSNGSCGGSYLCTGGSGYRGPTGVGTPDGVLSQSSTPPPPALAVTSVSPAEGSTRGGTSVVIKGTGFVKGATVKIAGKASSVTVHSETEITAVTPSASAGSDEVIVTDEHGTSSAGPKYAYVAPPVPAVSSVSPAEGSTHGGAAVTITGSGFVSGATVKIAGKASSVKVRSESEITAVTPSASAGSDEVIVTDENGVSSGGPRYTFVAPPVPAVSSVSPAEGSTRGGTAITIKGSGFVSGATVKIGGKASSVKVRSESEITAVTPSTGAGSDEVIVTDENGVSSGGPKYKFVAPPLPAVSSISPFEGPTSGGMTVTIRGSNFVSGASVKIGKAALSVSVRSATEITVKTPSYWSGSDEVIVSDENGTSSGGPSYTYRTPAPAATTSVKLACVGTQICSGTMALTADSAIAASRKTDARAPAVAALATAAFSIVPGRVSNVTLALSATGRALISSAHAGVNVTLTVVPGSASASQAPAQSIHLHLIRRAHRSGKLVRSAAARSGGLAAVLVGSAAQAHRP